MDLNKVLCLLFLNSILSIDFVSLVNICYFVLLTPEISLIDVFFRCRTEVEKLSVVGSPFWMAPEVLRDEPYNEKVKLQLDTFVILVLQRKTETERLIMKLSTWFHAVKKQFWHFIHFFHLWSCLVMCNLHNKMLKLFPHFLESLKKTSTLSNFFSLVKKRNT